MTWAATAMAGGALISGYSGKQAADAQEDAAKDAIEFQIWQYMQNKKSFSPIMESGTTARNQLMAQLGLGGDAKAYDVTNMPGYSQALTEGINAVNQGGAGAGMLMSGERLKGLQSVGHSVFGNYYQNYLNRLSGLSDQGLSATNALAGHQGAITQGVASSYADKGAAAAAGHEAIGQGLGGIFGAGMGAIPAPGGGGGGGGVPMELNLSSMYRGL